MLDQINEGAPLSRHTNSHRQTCTRTQTLQSHFSSSRSARTRIQQQAHTQEPRTKNSKCLSPRSQTSVDKPITKAFEQEQKNIRRSSHHLETVSMNLSAATSVSPSSDNADLDSDRIEQSYGQYFPRQEQPRQLYQPRTTLADDEITDCSNTSATAYSTTASETCSTTDTTMSGISSLTPDRGTYHCGNNV